MQDLTQMHPDAKAGRFKVLASHSAVNTLATSCNSLRLTLHSLIIFFDSYFFQKKFLKNQ